MAHFQDRIDLGELATHWPVLRSGTPWDTRDLRRLASVDTARSVVILDDGSDDGLANS